jgi:DNA-binding response OmpR family regulator
MKDKIKTIASDYAPPRRILYVENHKDSREMLALTLERAGYAVSTADSVADGLNLTRREHFDLIILDSRFTDGSGLDLCRQIRAFDTVIPIIFYSSSAYPSDIAAGLAAGAQQFLIKPLGIYTITQTIAEMLTEAKVTPVLLPEGVSMKDDMENNSKEKCPLCNQQHAEEFKNCSNSRLPLGVLDKDIPSSEPRISRDADNGAAIVAGHAEEG